MGAQFLSSIGLGFGILIERARCLPVPALDKSRSPRFGSILQNLAVAQRAASVQFRVEAIVLSEAESRLGPWSLSNATVGSSDL